MPSGSTQGAADGAGGCAQRGILWGVSPHLPLATRAAMKQGFRGDR
jgi:hypothetical protein